VYDPFMARLSGTNNVKRGVIGVMMDGPRLLMVRRGPNVSRPGCWCFPGGHLEAGETPGRAIIREMREELNVAVALRSRSRAVQLPDAGYVLAVWIVDHLHGTLRPAPAEIAETRWCTPAEIRALEPALPSNGRVLEMLGV
jgi:8-oxo-dGTP diphosphatase